MAVQIFSDNGIPPEVVSAIDQAVRNSTYNAATVTELHDYGDSYSAIVATVSQTCGPTAVAHMLEGSLIMRELKFGKVCLFRVGERRKIPVKLDI